MINSYFKYDGNIGDKYCPTLSDPVKDLLDDENIELLNEFFEKKQIKLDVTCPKKGDKAKLINMVENNIQINIEDRKKNVLADLSEILSLSFEINSTGTCDKPSSDKRLTFSVNNDFNFISIKCIPFGYLSSFSKVSDSIYLAINSCLSSLVIVCHSVKNNETSFPFCINILCKSLTERVTLSSL